MITLVPVTSSNINTIGHDPIKNELLVQFKSGAIYVYAGVSAAIHEALMAAESKGIFMNQQIKGVFAFSKL